MFLLAKYFSVPPGCFFPELEPGTKTERTELVLNDQGRYRFPDAVSPLDPKYAQGEKQKASIWRVKAFHKLRHSHYVHKKPQV